MPQKKQQGYAPYNPNTSPTPLVQPGGGYTPFVPPTPYQSPLLEPVEGYGGGLYNVASEVAAPITRPILSTISPVLDVLSRGQYFSAKFFDSSADTTKGVWDNLKDAWQEAIDPKERLSFSDVIYKRAPKFAAESPNATAILGFLGDIALDPTTYIGVGLAKKGLQVAGKTLSRTGIEALKLAEEVGTKTRFVERKIAENVKLVDVLKMSDKYPAQKAYYLQELGFTDEVARRAQEIDKISGGKLGIDRSSKVAEKELIKEVKYDYYNGLVNDLSTGEVRERAEQRIMRITEALPEFKSFESRGLRLNVNIPFVVSKEIPGTAKFFDIIGVNRLGENIADLASRLPGKKFRSVVGQSFNKYYGSEKVPQEFLDNLTAIENKKDSLIQGVLRDVTVLGKGVNEERRKLIQETMYKIDDASRVTEENLGRGLTQVEADKIKMNGLQAAKLTPQEHAFVASLYQGYAEMGELEMRANLLRSSLANYTHREYEVVKDATQAGNVLRPPTTVGTGTFLGSSQSRDYLTIAEARASGKVPEMDALTIYAQRLIKHRDRMANTQFNESVRHSFGLDTSVYGKQLTNQEFQQLPLFARNSIKMLGESVYPTGMNETVRDFLKVVDTATGWWKRGAYAIKPSSAPKQLIGNTVLGAMQAGIKTFKVFDPRALMDAALMVTSKAVPEKALPKAIKDMIAKGFGGDAELAERIALRNFIDSNDLNNYVKGWKGKSVLGSHLDGAEEYKFMIEGGVIKGFDASGESLKIKVNNALKKNPNSIGSVAGDLAKVWNWPSFAEDYSRASLYLNARRMGYSQKESVKLVNKALFDYSRGLSHVEKNVFKRILPFYTFPRFAIPRVLQNLVTKPGEALTVNKFVNLLGKLNSGDTLTPAEQEAIPGFILEQPRVFNGFDKEGKLGFNTFNGLTPFDAISLLVKKPNGDIDFPRTVEKSVLAAVTPFIKVPAELAMRNEKGERGFNFFTGRTLKEAGKLGQLDGDTKLNTILPQFVKDAIGWEIRKDPVGGKPKAYVNPYLAHTVSSAIPGIKSYINLGDGSKTPLERSMELIFGISKVKVDLKAQNQWDLFRDKKEIADLKSRIRQAQLKGSKNEFEQAFKEYNDFIRAISNKRALPGQDTVRGQGLVKPEDAQQSSISGTTQTFK